MMDIFTLQYNYQSKYLVLIDSDVDVHKYENCKFDQLLLSVKSTQIFFGESNVCSMTKFSGAGDKEEFDGITLLLEW